MSNEVYLRPSTRNGGVYQVNNIQSHNHDATSATAGAHNHTGTTSSDTHTHLMGGGYFPGGGGTNGGYTELQQRGTNTATAIVTGKQIGRAHV